MGFNKSENCSTANLQDTPPIPVSLDFDGYSKLQTISHPLAKNARRACPERSRRGGAASGRVWTQKKGRPAPQSPSYSDEQIHKTVATTKKQSTTLKAKRKGNLGAPSILRTAIMSGICANPNIRIVIQNFVCFQKSRNPRTGSMIAIPAANGVASQLKAAPNPPQMPATKRSGPLMDRVLIFLHFLSDSMRVSGRSAKLIFTWCSWLLWLPHPFACFWRRVGNMG